MDPEILVRLNANLESLITVTAESRRLPAPRRSLEETTTQQMILRNQDQVESQALKSRESARRYAFAARQRADREAARRADMAQKKANKDAERMSAQLAKRAERLSAQLAKTAKSGQDAFLRNLKVARGNYEREQAAARKKIERQGKADKIRREQEEKLEGREGAKIASRRRDALWGGLSQIGESLTSPSSPTGRTGQLMAGISRMGKAIPGKVGVAIGGAGKLGEVLFKSIGFIEKWNEQLRAGDIRLAQYSGRMATVLAETEVWEVRFSRERGDARAETAREREAAYREMRERLAPQEDFLANAYNKIGAFASQNAEWIAGIITPLGHLLRLRGGQTATLVGEGEEERGRNISMGGIFADVASGNWIENYGRPANFSREWYVDDNARPN